jgi:serine/threonine protein kinase
MSQFGDEESFSSAAPDASHLELSPGYQVGEYEILEIIGRGGFGTVFKAVHPLIGKVVAIKVLHPAYSAQPQVVSRFIAEARAVNRIQHKNIIDIFGFGKLETERGQLHYYVMEHLQGESLEDFLKGQGRLPVDTTLSILRPIARALHAAHQNGIAHRDLKGDNIFLAEDRERFIEPRLLDFGIAKLLHDELAPGHRTRDGVPLGTPGYMSPEQCLGQAVDHRTDIYAFGILAYRMLTGTLPFRDKDSYMQVMFAHIHSPPPSPRRFAPDLPERVEQSILSMLAKNPADRPQSMLAAQQSLEDAATAAGVALLPESSRLTLSLLHRDRPASVGDEAMMNAATLDASSAELQAVTPRPVGPVSDAAFSGPGPIALPTTVDGRHGGRQGVRPAVREAVPDDASGPILPTRRTAVGAASRSRALVLVLAAAALAGLAILAAVRWPRDHAAMATAPAGTAQPLQASPEPIPAAIPAASPEAIPDTPVPAPSSAPAAPSTASADPAAGAALAALPQLVTITVTGPPAGTEVYGPNGLLGVVPGAIQLPRGDAEVRLTFRAEGHRTVTQAVTPAVATTLTVTLERKGGRPRTPRSRQDGDGNVRDQLESPF